ncbi:MAG: hypothetical protein JO329_13875 [Planctomycetaceae bacterium]|nr:hypothetical protein [Planctomycetaceae bacterium]MBV8313879.1 hypothetical protein [Planctomycetaceae bacterium]
MARTTERPFLPDLLPRAWDFVIAGRPLLALTTVWLTTAGHTMNFRELGIAQGWVTAELFSLQTCLLFSIALTLLACPAWGQRFPCRGLTQVGLALLAIGSLLNGTYLHAPLSVFLAGRAIAGVGSGLVIYFAPRLLDPRWGTATAWAAIILPTAGPGVISAASMFQGVSDWEWGFLFEGAFALFCLVLLLFQADRRESPPPAPQGSLAYLPCLVLGSAALLYCLHWGQLHGWLESFDIVIAAALGTFALTLALVLGWPRLDLVALKENWIRLLLFFYGGLCQFFHGYTMNVYGGLLINFSTWQRSLLIWWLPLGIATGLSLAQLVRRRWNLTLDLPGTIAGLLILAFGLYLSHQRTIDWPFWQTLNQVDLNWFQAPQQWELAPSRFLMGMGIGLLMIAMDNMVSPDPEREEKIRPFLVVAQFFGGGIAAGLFVNWLMIGHQIQYSYSADRDYIQAEEMADRRTLLRNELAQAGSPAPDYAAEVLQYRAVNYEADNQVFADIYGKFIVASVSLAGLCLGLLAWKRLRSPPEPGAS